MTGGYGGPFVIPALVVEEEESQEQAGEADQAYWRSMFWLRDSDPMNKE